MKSEFEPRSTDRKFWKENVHREIYRLLSAHRKGRKCGASPDLAVVHETRFWSALGTGTLRVHVLLQSFEGNNTVHIWYRATDSRCTVRRYFRTFVQVVLYIWFYVCTKRLSYTHAGKTILYCNALYVYTYCTCTRTVRVLVQVSYESTFEGTKVLSYEGNS